MTLYGYPRETPAPDDMPSVDRERVPPSLRAAGRASLHGGPYDQSPPPNDYRGTRRAADDDVDPGWSEPAAGGDGFERFSLGGHSAHRSGGSTSPNGFTPDALAAGIVDVWPEQIAAATPDRPARPPEDAVADSAALTGRAAFTDSATLTGRAAFTDGAALNDHAAFADSAASTNGVGPQVLPAPAMGQPGPLPDTSPMVRPGAMPRRATGVPWTDIAIPDDDLEIAPWDRRPLMIVIAAAAILVLIAILSGVAASALFNPGRTTTTWRPAGSASVKPSPKVAQGAPTGADIVTLSGVGDVIMGTQPDHLPPRKGSGIFDPVKAWLASDLVMGNLETPLTADTGYAKCRMVTPTPTPGGPTPTPVSDPNCHQFYLPASYADRLRDGGFRVMNLANNHSTDMGSAGLDNTRSALKAAGLQPTGGRNEISYVSVRGIRLAVLGFSVYSSGANLNDIAAATDLVRRATQHADVVVIQMQAGAEGADRTHVRPGHEYFLGEDRGDEIAFTHAAIDAGADVVFGHGPHVMRGMQFYKGRLIAYSLGNFCGYGVLSANGYLGVGGILRVSLHKDGTWAGGSLVPTEMIRGGLPTVDPGRRAIDFVNGLSTADFGATAARLSSVDGTITTPTL